MFTCLLCTENFADSARSEEHVFPDAIGGLLRLFDLCVPCNTHLGSTADAPLADHFLIQLVRRRFALAGKAGRIPNPFTRGHVQGDPSVRVRLEPGGRVFMHPRVENLPNGGARVSVDIRDLPKREEMIRKIVERRRKPDEHVVYSADVETVETRQLEFPMQIDVSDYERGMLKIAYELACLVLGPSYLNDPMAHRFRTVLRKKESTRDEAQIAGLYGVVAGLVGDVKPMSVPRPSWLVGLVVPSGVGHVVSYVRVFDTFEATLRMSDTCDAYALPAIGKGWIIDVEAKSMRPSDALELSRELRAGEFNKRQ
jgi:hypothetical protein